MANIQSAKKRIRQNAKRRVHNRHYRASARTYVRKVRSQITTGNIEDAEATMQTAVSALDKAARKGIIHPRNAARRKSRLMAALAAAKK